MQSQDMKQIIVALNENGEEGHLPEEEAPHAYPVNIGGVQGVLMTREEVSPEFFTNSTVAEQQELRPDYTGPVQKAKREPPYFLYFVLILLLFLVLDSVNSALTSLFTPTATITIVTGSHQINTNAVFTIPTSSFKQVSFTETGSTLASGEGHKAATFAHGEVTLYNTAFYGQTIPQGTLITTGAGVNIVTLHDVYIGAGNGASNGVASVEAQADMAGAQGNISAYTVNGPCCKEGIIARNLYAFSGGADARDFQFVTATDIKGVQNSLFSKIYGELQVERGKIPTSDVLLTPIPCSNNVQANHSVGDEATSLTVTVSQNCTIVTYAQKAFNQRLTSEVLSRVVQEFGTGYMLLGAPTTSDTNTKIQSGQITFSTSSTALYGLDFRASRINELSKLIAGLSRQEALSTLKNQTGVTRISLTISNGMSLPYDTTNMHFVVIYQREVSTS
jgi:Baseplate J-like protein